MDTEWELHPLGGETGQAYMGVKDQEHIFLKRNTTPFLAAVSTEGIAPKMLWTKRTVHGEVLTAQTWIDARLLETCEMVEYDVLELVRYIHLSKPLLSMLYRMKGDIYFPIDFLHVYEQDLQHDLKTHSFLAQVLDYLKRVAPHIENSPKTVCHGDLNHRNFLLEKQGRLYLVDWEMVKIADPISDIASLLCQYVDRKDWLMWLDVYGIDVDQNILRRLEWYALYYCLMDVKKSQFQGRYHQMNRSILLMKELLGKQRLL
ncbi:MULTISPECIES: phosphotransferase family protein [unclassified Granulicatella]|uniref:phosphotransferase family protein n=1 Tax=unclassified Granulicatella TaxID=2630493 RepID=UPI001073AD7E|nr:MULTISPECIES: phosphotransferase family protein [unclassified Granulicatella]MBF0779709.1 phosphotransferase family protein [Granulicatella sp. 19428wC4_WM01]TFU96230.1 phosphotransferase [Granulicatella sp. WM01]